MPAVVTSCPRPRSSRAISRSVAGSSSTTRICSDAGRAGSASTGPRDRLAAALGRRLRQGLAGRPGRSSPGPCPRSRPTSVPPWPSTIPLLIARPRPRPPNLRVIVVSPCWNGSKILGRTSGSMPMPVSVTSTIEAVAPRSPRLVAGPDRDRPALGRELDGVLDQVPEDLLQPGRVGVDVVVRRRPGPASSRSPLPRTSLRQICDGLLDQVVAVGDLPVQRHLAPDDPHHVEQVVDQAGLEVHVLADHLQVRPDLLGRRGPLEHRRRRPAGSGSAASGARGSSTARNWSFARLASSASARAACSAASSRSRSASCRFRSVMSRNTRTTPAICPSCP